VILRKGTYSIDIGNAEYPYEPKTEMVVAEERTASGVRHVEHYNVEIGTMTFNFKLMPDDIYRKLVDWFLNVAVGPLHEFELINDFGDSFMVKFSDKTIEFRNVDYNIWSGKFTVEVVT
jgi:hypothetical protein